MRDDQSRKKGDVGYLMEEVAWDVGVRSKDQGSN